MDRDDTVWEYSGTRLLAIYRKDSRARAYAALCPREPIASSPAQALETLTRFRESWLAQGVKWDRCVEAARDEAVARMRGLPPEEDAFLVGLLEEAYPLARPDGKEVMVCDAIVKAIETREATSAAPLLCRILLNERCDGRLRRNMPGILVQWDALAAAPALHEAMRSPDGLVRAFAANALASGGVITDEEIARFLADPDESVGRLTLNGLANCGTPYAVYHLASVGRTNPDERLRRLALELLSGLQMMLGRGGRC